MQKRRKELLRGWFVLFLSGICRGYRRVPARRAAHSVHALPPADLSRMQRLVVSQVHSPPFGEVAVSLSCPDVRFTPLLLNDYPARSVPSARRYPCQTNKSFSSPSGLNNVAPFVSGTRAKQTKAPRHPMLLTSPQAFSHTLCASRLAVALQRMKPPLILVLRSNRMSSSCACFYAWRSRAGCSPCLLPPRAYSARLPGLRAGLLRGECCPGLPRFASPPPREDKGRRSVVRGEGRQKIGFFALNRAKTR